MSEASARSTKKHAVLLLGRYHFHSCTHDSAPSTRMPNRSAPIELRELDVLKTTMTFVPT